MVNCKQAKNTVTYKAEADVRIPYHIHCQFWHESCGIFELADNNALNQIGRERSLPQEA